MWEPMQNQRWWEDGKGGQCDVPPGCQDGICRKKSWSLGRATPGTFTRAVSVEGGAGQVRGQQKREDEVPRAGRQAGGRASEGKPEARPTYNDNSQALVSPHLPLALGTVRSR